MQKYVATLKAKNQVLQAIPPVILVPFAGHWSDRHGRKLLMVIAMFGFIISNTVFLLNILFFYELKAEYLLFECLQDATGGRPVFCLAAYAYISDVSKPKTRLKRLAYLDGFFPFGFYIGNALSAIIKTKLGFASNFGFAIMIDAISILYCVFFVKNSRIIQDRNFGKEVEEPGNNQFTSEMIIDERDDANRKSTTKRQANRITKLLSHSANTFVDIVLGFVSLVKGRKNKERTILILLVIGFVLEVFFLNGFWSSHFLFLRKRLNWTSIEYTRYTSILGLIGLLSQYVVIPFLVNQFRLRDSTISMLESSTSIINLLILAFVHNEWMLYIGGLISFLDTSAITVFRSMISKAVNDDEIGKMFSVVGLFHALLPFATGPLFGYLYSETVEHQPNAFLFLLIIIKVILFMVVALLKKIMGKEDKFQ